MHQRDEADDDAGNDRRADERVGDAAMVLEALNRADEGLEEVDVGGFGGEDRGQRAVSGGAVQAGAADACAGKKVRDGLHREIVSRAGARADLKAPSNLGTYESELRAAGPLL